ARTSIAKTVNGLLARARYRLISTDRYGIDPFRDVRRLSSLWKREVETFFDVGANRGQTAMKALDTFPNARVISFEPDARAFSELMKSASNSHRFTGVNMALAAAIKSATLYTYEESELNSLIPNAQFSVRFGKKPEPIEVTCTTI